VAPPRPAALRIGVSALLVIATFAAYAGVREHRFVDVDDFPMIVHNPDLRAASPGEAVAKAFRARALGNWTPLSVLSLQASQAAHGLDPPAYLLTNVALHAAAAVLLFLALARMTGAPWPSAFTAGVFALHPLHVESVAWAAMRKDSLMGLFWMLTLLAHARHAERPSRGRYAAVLLGLVAALMSKPVAVTLPCVLLLLDAWPLGRLGRPGEARLAWLEKLPMLLPVAGVCAITLLWQDESNALPDLAKLPLRTRLANAVDAYAAYVRSALWPRGLNFLYPHPAGGPPAGRVALEAAVLLALSAGALAQRRSRPYLAVGWLWFLGTLVPTIGLVQAGVQARADRYTYLPLVGLTLAVAWGAAGLSSRGGAARRALAVLAGGSLLALAVCTSLQVRHWRDAVALHTRSVQVQPDNALEHYRLAHALLRDDRPREAIPHLERTAALAPALAEPLVDLGDVYASLGQRDQAMHAWQRALQRAGGPGPLSDALRDRLGAPRSPPGPRAVR
jgi:tetratricopeptide (TPR) repeat protein